MTIERAYDAIRQHVSLSDTVKCSIARNVKNRYGESSKTQMVQMLFVNESGVYSLVFGSKLESAQRFKLQVPIGDAERSMKLGQVYTHTYLVWTERGRKFIHDLAKRMWDLAEYERLKFKVKVMCFNKVQTPC